METTSKGEHPGNLILEAANTGASLMLSITKFLTYRNVPDNSLLAIYATASITTTLLREIAATFNEYETTSPVKSDLVKPIAKTCKENFDRLLVVINECTAKGICRNEGTLGGVPVAANVDPWFLLHMGLGGWDESQKLWMSLNKTRSTLFVLKDTIKYMILKNLNQQNMLDPGQVEEELKKLRALLPRLVLKYQLFEEPKGKEGNAAMETRAAAELTSKNHGEASSLRRTESDGCSDITLPVNNESVGRREFAKDVDCESSDSDTLPGSRDCRDDEDVYEEWLLQYYGVKSSPDKSYSFLGLKFKKFFDDPASWATDPELRSQSEMKEQYLFASAGMSPAKHKDAMKKAIQMIPKDGGHQIDKLIQDRTKSCSDEKIKRQWSVVAVRPQQKYPYSSSKKWGKDQETTNWLITIRGETVDTVERHRPYRGEDPWSTRTSFSSSSSERFLSPRRRPHRINHTTGVIPRRQNQSSVRGVPLPVEPLPNHQSRSYKLNEGAQAGTVVVQKLMSEDEAEKKLEKILAEMSMEASSETAS